MIKWVNARIFPFFVLMHDQIKAMGFCHVVAESNHVFKFPARIYMQKRKWKLGRIERFKRQMQHHC